jgi:hypothetical protein
VRSGYYRVEVFATHGGRILHDTTTNYFQAYGYDAMLSGMNLRDTIPAGSFTPIALVINCGQVAGWVKAEWRILRDDTLSVYAQSESACLEAGANQQLRFPLWNATNGNYLARLVATHNGIVLRDTTRRRFAVTGEGLQEVPPLLASSSRWQATVVRGMLWLPPASSPKPQASSWLLDASGQRVMKLHPGANDMSLLAPGVYFVHEQLKPKHPAQAIRKIVLTR